MTVFEEMLKRGVPPETVRKRIEAATFLMTLPGALALRGGDVRVTNEERAIVRRNADLEVERLGLGPTPAEGEDR